MNNFYIWFAERYIKHKVAIHAGQVTFFLLMSFLPTVMLLLKLIPPLLGIDESALVTAIENIGPGALRGILSTMLDGISMPSGGTYVFTVISMLWAGSKGFDGLAQGLDSIYGTRGKRGYVVRRAFSVVYLVGFILMILVSAVLILFGKLIIRYCTEHFSLPFDGFLINFVLRYGLILVLFVTFFVLLFRFGPFTPAETKEERELRKLNNKGKARHERIRRPKNRTWKKELPGAILTAFLWIVFTRFFSIYVDYRLANPSYYGSLVSLFLVLLWLYFCNMFILVGALYNNYYYRTGERPITHLISDLPGLFAWIRHRFKRKGTKA